MIIFRLWKHDTKYFPSSYLLFVMEGGKGGKLWEIFSSRRETGRGKVRVETNREYFACKVVCSIIYNREGGKVKVWRDMKSQVVSRSKVICLLKDFKLIQCLHFLWLDCRGKFNRKQHHLWILTIISLLWLSINMQKISLPQTKHFPQTSRLQLLPCLFVCHRQLYAKTSLIRFTVCN